MQKRVCVWFSSVVCVWVHLEAEVQLKAKGYGGRNTSALMIDSPLVYKWREPVLKKKLQVRSRAELGNIKRTMFSYQNANIDLKRLNKLIIIILIRLIRRFYRGRVSRSSRPSLVGFRLKQQRLFWSNLHLLLTETLLRVIPGHLTSSASRGLTEKPKSGS